VLSTLEDSSSTAISTHRFNRYDCRCRTRVRLFSYAAAYRLVTRRGEVRVPRNTLSLVIAVLVIILLIYLIFQFI
jgi:hypothetical protein